MINESKNNPEQTDPAFEQLIERALRSCGWLLPRTAEDVRHAELDPEIQATELPESLRDPFRILERATEAPVASSGDTATDPQPETVSIPPALAQLAGEEGLTYQQSVTLLGWYGQQFANRSSTKKQQPDLDDWRRLYKDVKEFL
jgi:hypothetical protein